MNQGLEIYNQLPQQLKSGSAFQNPQDIYQYIALYIISAIYFFVLYFTLEQTFIMIKFEAFINRNKAAQIRFLALWTNNVFYVILVAISFYTMATACSPYSKHPISGIDSLFAWFYNDQCFLQFDSNYVNCIMVVNGFLTSDYIVTKYWFLDPNKLTGQTLLHHVLAITGFSVSIFAGYGLSSVSACSLICEISSLFLNYKDMFSKVNRNSPLS